MAICLATPLFADGDVNLRWLNEDVADSDERLRAYRAAISEWFDFGYKMTYQQLQRIIRAVAAYKYRLDLDKTAENRARRQATTKALRLLNGVANAAVRVETERRNAETASAERAAAQRQQRIEAQARLLAYNADDAQFETTVHAHGSSWNFIKDENLGRYVASHLDIYVRTTVVDNVPSFTFEVDDCGLIEAEANGWTFPERRTKPVVDTFAQAELLIEQASAAAKRYYLEVSIPDAKQAALSELNVLLNADTQVSA